MNRNLTSATEEQLGCMVLALYLVVQDLNERMYTIFSTLQMMSPSISILETIYMPPIMAAMIPSSQVNVSVPIILRPLTITSPSIPDNIDATTELLCQEQKKKRKRRTKKKKKYADGLCYPVSNVSPLSGILDPAVPGKKCVTTNCSSQCLDSNELSPSSLSNTPLLTNLEKCWQFNTKVSRGKKYDVTFENVNDLAHLELTATSTHKAAEKTVSNNLDSLSCSNAHVCHLR